MASAFTPLATAAVYASSIATYAWFWYKNASPVSTTPLLYLWSAHFARRAIESVFLSKYERSMTVGEMVMGFVYYGGVGALNGWWNNSSEVSSSFSLNYIGAALFVLGELGNHYHHYLLAKLRSGGQKGYQIPKGGFFSSVVMPHYGFEIISCIGWCIALNHISYPAIGYTLVASLAMYGKAKEKKALYLKKFDGSNGQPKYSEQAKLLFPFLL